MDSGTIYPLCRIICRVSLPRSGFISYIVQRHLGVFGFGVFGCPTKPKTATRHNFHSIKMKMKKKKQFKQITETFGDRPLVRFTHVSVQLCCVNTEMILNVFSLGLKFQKRAVWPNHVHNRCTDGQLEPFCIHLFCIQYFTRLMFASNCATFPMVGMAVVRDKTNWINFLAFHFIYFGECSTEVNDNN